MDLREIQYFLAVAEEKNMSVAAQKLHISQPPLSRTIKSLEKEIGVPLFNRKLSGLELTEAGHTLVKHGEQLILLHEQIMHDMKEISSKFKNRIIFGGIDGSKELVVPYYVKMFRKSFEYADVTVEYLPTAEITSGILKGSIDIAFIRTPFSSMEEFDIIEVNRENWIALISKNYPSSEEFGQYVTKKELIEHPLILPSRQSLYLPLVKELTIDNKLPDVICYYFEIRNAVTLANHKLGIAIVPNIIVNLIESKNYIIKNIKDLDLTTGYCAIKKKGECSTETTRQFWEMIKRKGYIF